MKTKSITIAGLVMILAGIGVMVFSQCMVKVDGSTAFWNYKWAYTVAILSDSKARAVFFSGLFLFALGYIVPALIFKARKKAETKKDIRIKFVLFAQEHPNHHNCKECGRLAHVRVMSSEELWNVMMVRGGSKTEAVCFNKECSVYGRPYHYLHTPKDGINVRWPTPQDPIVYHEDDPNIFIMGRK
ncbi:MAG TPA: hypothetical protein P5096_02060 [Patescibacteria group bacterium]|nr:hypothetical protein [Patescibacteria group bacterium]